MVIGNQKLRCLSFFAHEIGHTIEGTPFFNKIAYLGTLKGEYSANRFAINLLSMYCLENDIWYETVFDFARSFGIPKDKWYLLEKYKNE